MEKFLFDHCKQRETLKMIFCFCESFNSFFETDWKCMRLLQFYSFVKFWMSLHIPTGGLCTQIINITAVFLDCINFAEKKTKKRKPDYVIVSFFWQQQPHLQLFKAMFYTISGLVVLSSKFFLFVYLQNKLTLSLFRHQI